MSFPEPRKTDIVLLPVMRPQPDQRRLGDGSNAGCDGHHKNWSPENFMPFLDRHTMTLSLIRSRAMISRALDRHACEEIADGAVLQEDGVILKLGTFAELKARYRD